MVKYVRKVKRANRKYAWILSPPRDLLKAGIARRATYQDIRVATAASRDMEKLVEDYRSGKVVSKDLSDDCTLNQLAAHFKETKRFQTLARSSRNTYSKNFDFICKTPYKNITVGELKVKDFTSRLANELFEKWSKEFTAYKTNFMKLFLSMLLKYAVSFDILNKNPAETITKLPTTIRSIVWNSKDVQEVVDLCMSSFPRRNLGLAILLCYEWSQRPVDIYKLQWKDIDLETNTVTITQQKRGKTVYIPIDGRLRELLVKQKEDFGFQPYVCPHLRFADKKWVPYESGTSNRIFNEVREELDLPKDLRIGDLRKTAIVEAISGGADSAALIQLTGHSKIAGLNPYVKNTRAGAYRALEAIKIGRGK